ncbi:MAG: TetR/AcrR family transcriptional regulator [Actinobacteria bacterium]|jgi:AcrR family transcriptional regulator|nr:MAG: TetR/AcrR family transcriptional regulator [Actinomycetota bacterium]
MAYKTALSGEERRLSIITAARPLFAEKGFHATSIREIAKAANVSEALIYKHFPSKEAIYDELLDYAREMLRVGLTGMEGMEYGTRTLVLLVFGLVEVIMLDVPGRIPDQKMHERLLFQSLTGDTVFARGHFKMLRDNWENTVIACFRAAEEAGDVAESPIPPTNLMWFVHHLAMALNLCHLSGEAAFDYEVSREELAEQAVLFCLKGIGMTDEAIGEYYRPGELRETLDRVYE